MTASLSINPFQTTNAAGSFNVDASGFVQGTFFDDPAVRYALAGGTLLSTETLPMWGGVGISELTPAAYSATVPAYPLGTQVSRALSLVTQAAGQMTGFSVFNQAHAMVNSPQSPVPLSGTGGLVNFFRFKSGARIALAMNPSLITLQNSLITTNVSWDFTAQELIPGVAAYNADNVTNASYNSTTGVVTITLTTGGELAVGDQFTLSGIISTGAGANLPNGYNGTFVAITGTTGTTLTYQGVPGGGANSPGTYSSAGKLNAGGGYLPVNILDINAGNSMIVSYNSGTGFATWNRSGYAAVVQI